jgi:predicted dehydrogenase
MTAWMEDAALNGGGAWIDEGSHAIDLMRWVAGDIARIALMTANRAKQRFRSEDAGAAIIAFASGALGEVGTLWSMAVDIGMRNHIEIYGTRGTLIMRATDPVPAVLLYDANGTPLTRGWAIPHIEADAKEPHDYGSWPPHLHHYKREVASFVHRYLNDLKPWGPTLADGLACLRVIEAGYRSAAAGGAPQEIPATDAFRTEGRRLAG